MPENLVMMVRAFYELVFNSKRNGPIGADSGLTGSDMDADKADIQHPTPFRPFAIGFRNDRFEPKVPVTALCANVGHQ